MKPKLAVKPKERQQDRKYLLWILKHSEEEEVRREGRVLSSSRNLSLLQCISQFLSVLFCFLSKTPPSSLEFWTCSGACNCNTMSNAGENSQGKLSMSSHASGCEILNLTSLPLMKGHGGTGRGVDCTGYFKMGKVLLGMLYLWKSLCETPG